jgi:hypothetical protein
MTLGNMRELGIHHLINVTVAAASITRAWAASDLADPAMMGDTDARLMYTRIETETASHLWRTLRPIVLSRPTTIFASRSRELILAASDNSRVLLVIVIWRREQIAGSVHGLDQLRVARIVTQLAPKLCDMNVDAAVRGVPLPTSDHFEDLIAPERSPRFLHQGR